MQAAVNRKRKMKYREQSLRFPVAVLYILVVILIVAESLFFDHKMKTLLPLDWVYLGSGFLGLLLLEWLESAYYPRRVILPVRLTLLALRIFCVTAIYQVNTGVTSPMISALIIYTAFFYFGLIPVMLMMLGVILFLLIFQPGVFQAGLVSEIAVMIYMGLFAAVIKQDDRTRLHNRELYKELTVYAGHTASLAKQEERNRISRELHDSLGHYLVGMNIQLQKAAAYREIDPAQSDLAVQKAQQASTNAMRELRQTLSDLREMEEPFDFKEEVQKLVVGAEESGLDVTFSYNGSPDGYPELVLMTVRRAVQEGLTNIQKHAQAQKAELKIDFGRRDVTLLLTDDGIGFSKKRIERDGHYGLSGLEERVDLVGGKIRIVSRKAKGTRIQMRIPKTQYS